ncbi:WcaI family glycosyltransferase [Stakelama sediminis]|uniref:Colanic acid biosynthesis glycosyl transferase WcaI n=1 Tax=Stakelama sediminis TaxID=463200 RepID=A0A840Z3D4_9SPHN|nr:WcaI family glycosyltransferase [Stakelama sediminis]MBB5720383.1 colanic acid biosynthesis glycosyl transferase WcaI [Stakelama sediminis]
MRILFLGLNYAPEQVGIGLYSGDMVRDWASRGHAVRAVVAQPYYPAWRTFDRYRGGWRRDRDEQRVDVIRCPVYVPATPTGAKRILHYLSFLASATLPLLKASLGWRPDLVFTVAPSLIAAPLAWLAARLSGAKCWLHVQDFEIEAAFATGLVSKGGLVARIADTFERWTLHRFDRVSSISAQMCATLIAKGVTVERVYQLRNWADIDAIQPSDAPSPFRSEWSIDTPHVALYSGNIANKQGIEIVLEAAKLLRHRSDLTFVVCGDGPNRARLIEASADVPNIQFHDLQPRERLNALLSLATVHLLPQLADAADLVLPSKLTNMLASGRPVVATAAVGTGLANEIEGCGIVTEPGSAKDFACAITRLIEDTQLCTTLGHTARQRAKEHWAYEAILGALDGALSDLITPISPT